MDVGVTSALAEVECLRSLDRMRLAGAYSDEMVADRRHSVYDLLESIEVVEVTASVLARAAQPFPTTTRTLNAIHLATALMWKERVRVELTMATHDRILAIGATAMGFRIVGA